MGRTSLRRRIGAAALLGACAIGWSSRSAATGVPIDGFLPLVGITLTDEFVDDIDFFPYPSTSIGGSPVAPGASHRYDLALLDSGAATSLITAAADAAFNIDGPYSGEQDGFRGTEVITIGGATGLLQASVGDPLGLYAAGLQSRSGSGASLTMPNSAMLGQTNTSIVTLPAESDLPNVLGLSFIGQYATRIRNSAPQAFELGGKTIRTPAIDFLPLGTGNSHGIVRKAPLSLLGSSPSTPVLIPNIANFNLDKPWENPSQPTVVQGGHFLNVNAANNGATLNGQQFFFDTGASVTVLSELTALQLGIDVTLDPPEFTVQIVGSGGISEGVPGYFIDEFTVLATGGSITQNRVPILVLDVTNPASPGNIVPGIVGTNLFAGRDIIIDPNPSLGGGGASAGVYISDPVTSQRNWTSAASSAPWSASGNWSGGAVPTLVGVANLRRVSGGSQEAVLSGAGLAAETNISGTSGTQTMTLKLTSGANLTTFSGVNIEAFGVLQLEGAKLDAQYVEIGDHATLLGFGTIRTGSGPIDGQVENGGGRLAVGDANGVGELRIVGRYSQAGDATLAYRLGGIEAGLVHGLLEIEGTAGFGGTLEITLKAGYAPTVGDVFTLASYEETAGECTTLAFPAGFTWDVDYGAQGLTLSVTGVTVPGDFNNSGAVGTADYTAWTNGFASPVGYDGADFLTWQRNFTSVTGVMAVPEPHGAWLLGAALVTAKWPASRRRNCPRELARGGTKSSASRRAVHTLRTPASLLVAGETLPKPVRETHGGRLTLAFRFEIVDEVLADRTA